MNAKAAYPVIDLAQTGRCIERQRRNAGLTVRELQAYFGFEYPQAIYKWQHGECLPSVDNLLALARLLKVSMEDLLVYEDQEVFPFLKAIRIKPILNYRFNAKHKKTCYSYTCRGANDTEKKASPLAKALAVTKSSRQMKSGRGPTSKEKAAFRPDKCGIRRIQQRCQRRKP